jgi:hypothetical protein
LLIALGIAPQVGNYETVRLRIASLGLDASHLQANPRYCGARSYEPVLTTNSEKQIEPLELDHVNGRRDDDRIETLRILCPNCHAQTSTYRGRNIGEVDLVS